MYIYIPNCLFLNVGVLKNTFNVKPIFNSRLFLQKKALSKKRCQKTLKFQHLFFHKIDIFFMSFIDYKRAV